MNEETRVGYVTIDYLCKELEPLLKSKWQRDNNPLYSNYCSIYKSMSNYLKSTLPPSFPMELKK